MLKNSLLFYTNLNFQRPISQLILIWDPLKFYHSWTLQMKLIIFGRSTPPKGWSVWGKCLQRLISVKCMTIYLKITLLFLYRFKFSEAYISLNIDMGLIKVLSFLDFVDQTDHLWQIYSPQGLVSLGEVPTKVISVESMTIYLKIPHYFYTDLSFQRPISHLKFIWDSLKFYHFWTFCRSN